MSNQPHQPLAADGGRGLTEAGLGPASAGEIGALPSNTAPPNYKKEKTKILFCGVDTLTVSYQGRLNDVIQTIFDERKEAAQSPELDQKANAVLPVNEHVFEVKSHGQGKFKYVLADNWYRMQFASRSAKSLPFLHATLSSELLTKCGLEKPLEELTNIATSLGHDVGEPTVSRLDICVDFATSEDLTEIRDEHWVSRAIKIARRSSNRVFSGYSIGEGGQVMCRLYDKTREIIEVSQKDYLHDVWKDSGWDGLGQVWRLEFQFRVEALRSMGIREITALQENLDSLWRYGTTEWLQLKTPSADSNQTRWPTHPVWTSLSETSFGCDRIEPLSRVRKVRVPSDDTLFKHGLGAFTSYMAREGLTDIDAALPGFMHRAHAYHRSRAKNLTVYARERAQVKAARFNTRSIAKDSDE